MGHRRSGCCRDLGAVSSPRSATIAGVDTLPTPSAPSSAPRPTRCYLVRHCEVENPARVLYGHLPGFPLSAAGVAQAQRLGEFFAATTARVIITSPLERARQTAAIIASHLDGVPVVVSDDLVEAEFARYLQGVPYREILWRRPRWWLHMAWPGLLPGDEPMSSLALRVRRQLNRVLATAPADGGICVSHGDPIQAFWATADRRPPWALHRLQCAKGGLLTLDYLDGTLVAKAYRAPTSFGADSGAAAEPAELPS